MPKTKLSLRNAQYRDLAILINGVVGVEKLEAEAVGKMMGLKSPTSARKFMRNPELLPLNRLLRLCKALGIPLDKVRECLLY